MNRLSDLPNISSRIEQRLLDAGIHGPDELIALGSREAFCRILLRDPHACVNLLCALEGAIQGIRWFYLPDEVKRELKTFHVRLSQQERPI